VDLYGSVKRFLEGRGYSVKGEVRGCDVVAVRGADEPPVVVEMKLAFTLSLVLQGVDRLAVTDLVYLALPAVPGRREAGGASRAFSPAHASVRRLCRRLGLGLMAVHPPGAAGGDGRVEVVLDPLPCRLPRRNKARKTMLLREHARRQGDPNKGGGPGGVAVVTAYRQEALRCAEFLRRSGGAETAVGVAAVREGAGVPHATRILYRNVYGWFEPAGRGSYRLTKAGEEGLEEFEGRFETADGGVIGSDDAAASG
jgi:hypothetical protein